MLNSSIIEPIIECMAFNTFCSLLLNDGIDAIKIYDEIDCKVKIKKYKKIAIGIFKNISLKNNEVSFEILLLHFFITKSYWYLTLTLMKNLKIFFLSCY